MSKYTENSWVKFVNYESGRDQVLKGQIEKFIGNGFYRINVNGRIYTKLENQIKGVIKEQV
jgi:hypothetical protein